MPRRRHRRKWHPLLPQDFLCCLSLQAGVVGSSVVGLTLMTITTLVNVYDKNDETIEVQAVQYILLALYLITMFVGFILSFLAAFWELSKLLRLASFLVFFGVVLYLIYVILSIVPNYNTMINVCPGLRCPDHHWLNQDHWRKHIHAEALKQRGKTTAPPNSMKEGDIPRLVPGRHQRGNTSIALLEEVVPKKANTSTTSTNASGLDITKKADTSTSSTTPSGVYMGKAARPLKEALPVEDPTPKHPHQGGPTIETPAPQEAHHVPDHHHQEGIPVGTPPTHQGHRHSKKSQKKEKRGHVVFIIISVVFSLFFFGFLIYSIITFLALAKFFDSRYD